MNIRSLTAEVIVSGLGVAVVAACWVIVDVLAVTEITACTSDTAGSECVCVCASQPSVIWLPTWWEWEKTGVCLTWLCMDVCVCPLRPLITVSASDRQMSRQSKCVTSNALIMLMCVCMCECVCLSRGGEMEHDFRDAVFFDHQGAVFKTQHGLLWW